MSTTKRYSFNWVFILIGLGVILYFTHGLGFWPNVVIFVGVFITHFEANYTVTYR